MAEYSATNYQNRRLGTSSRLRGMRNIDNALETSGKQLFIEKNGASRSCILASQTQHSSLRSACPPGTVIAKDDLAKYRRLRNCDPNLASRELGIAFHTTLFVQAAMRKHHGEWWFIFVKNYWEVCSGSFGSCGVLCNQTANLPKMTQARREKNPQTLPFSKLLRYKLLIWHIRFTYPLIK